MVFIITDLLILGFFWLRGMQDISLLTRNGTCACNGSVES